MTPLVAALTGAAAAALLVRPGVGTVRTRGRPSTSSAGPAWGLVPVLVLVVVGVTGTALVPLHVLVLGGIATGVAVGARIRSRRTRDAAAAAARRQRVVDFSEALCGELVAGRPVVAALERAVQAWPEAEPAARAARLGADVPAALRALGTRPGAEGVARLAAAWQLTATSGAGLAGAARRVLLTARARQATERLVAAEVASARATARLVCGLPVLVLLAAQGVGARPWVFLTGHPVGLACLALGLFLSWLGLTWIDRIATSSVEGAG